MDVHPLTICTMHGVLVCVWFWVFTAGGETLARVYPFVL